VQSRRRRETPQDVYERLQTFWRLHLVCESPDWEQLRDIHHTLSVQEEALRLAIPERCTANLHERLQDARRIGLDLVVPSWAAKEIVSLEAHFQQASGEGS
jgi:hypothetical protein